MKKKRLSIILVAFLPLFVVALGAEVGTFFAAYASARDSDYSAAVENDKATLIRMRLQIRVSNYDLLHQFEELYENNPLDAYPTDPSEQREREAVFAPIMESEDFAALSLTIPSKQSGEVVDHYLFGFVDEARGRFVVLVGTSDPSIRNITKTGYFFSFQATLTNNTFLGSSFYDPVRGNAYLTSGARIVRDPEEKQWLALRQTAEAKVYRNSDLFRERFVPIIFGTFGFTVVLVFLFTYLFLLRPIKKLSRSSDAYVESLRGGKAKPTFTQKAGKIQTEIGGLNDSLFYLQGAIEDYAVAIQEAAAKEQMARAEMEFAKRIQASMVPEHPLEGENFSFHGFMVPAKEVGGDFFDYFRIDDHRVGMVIGDVSGKGTPAALFMARAHTVAKLLLASEDIATINRTLCQENGELLFVTGFFAVIDLKTGAMDYVNCGHEQAYLRRDGVFSALPEEPNMPLGLDDTFPFQIQKASLMPGDALFLYTDGLSEATDINGELFGRFGVDAPLNQCQGLFGEELLAKMWEKASAFMGEAPQSDDCAMVLFEFRR